MSMCEYCAYYTYDEDYECYVCDVNMDEDEMYTVMQNKSAVCPYFRDGDEYKVVRKQN